MFLKTICNNFVAVVTDNVTIYFSYATPVAVTIYDALIISQNVWGPTTGKHLNMLSRDKKIRVSPEVVKKIAHDLIQIPHNQRVSV